MVSAILPDQYNGEEVEEQGKYESPEWDPQQIDLLGERLTASEERELRALEEQSDEPGYMQKVDALIATKLILHGIATYDQLYKGVNIHQAHTLFILSSNMEIQN